MANPQPSYDKLDATEARRITANAAAHDRFGVSRLALNGILAEIKAHATAGRSRAELKFGPIRSPQQPDYALVVKEIAKRGFGVEYEQLHSIHKITVTW